MNTRVLILLFGVVTTGVGGLIIARTWAIEWHEVIRAMVLHPGRKPGALLKLIGLKVAAGGIVGILAGLGFI